MILQTLSTIFLIIGLFVFGLGVIAFDPLIMAGGITSLILGAVIYEGTITKEEN